ncbi:hypothetical protein A8O14_00700 [Polynucleobacter wuianus]|uniref:Glycosyl transferase n=1 Tax=Polynucleobacter wuianus TaxID=1743168 RepID=A0A191UCY6_9BURK|nr:MULTISPECIES: hypothetical protein [Polynucleobacter]ANI98746.1 hypothetical protein A8O14_00700 [Polynucleobacter wuianus]MBU3553309.1 hypothetical protein [Polynucleobacter sp. MWH-Post4-6-1]
MAKDLKIHFFTIVLNGMPFIEKHIERFSKISPAWHWHIIEGVADLKNDTSWSIANGGEIDSSFHKDGLSIDGTSEYINSLKEKYPTQISIYRKLKGEFWNGKKEMVNAPLPFIIEESLLWQIDVDEFWSTTQMNNAYQLFINNPNKFSAFYWCEYFVGRDIVISTRGGYANNPAFEWERTWRFLPHFRWASHEPPTLVEKTFSGEIKVVRNRGIFSHQETEANGLVFRHLAYVDENQLRFKEKYYGYKDAISDWGRLQANKAFPTKLSSYFNWVNDDTLADKTSNLGIMSMHDFFD